MEKEPYKILKLRYRSDEAFEELKQLLNMPNLTKKDKKIYFPEIQTNSPKLDEFIK
jgi:hypothetical protein